MVDCLIVHCKLYHLSPSLMKVSWAQPPNVKDVLVAALLVHCQWVSLLRHMCLSL